MTTTVDRPLLNARELQDRLGISQRTFYRQLAENPRCFDHFKVTRPLGQRIYSARLVELYLSGQSTVRFGAGARKAS